MSTIVPAILEETKEAFINKVSIITRIPGVERIQVDFGDGQFVPHKTLSASDMPALNPAYVWEAHLMVKSPSDFLDYQIAGFSTIIVHLEAFTSPKELSQAIDQIKAAGLKPGVAINPKTDVSKLAGLLGVGQFTLLSVEPGFQGQEFLPESIERLIQLRNQAHNAIIEVDGGINIHNAAELASSGADFLVLGHGLFETENAAGNFLLLQQQANSINKN